MAYPKNPFAKGGGPAAAASPRAKSVLAGGAGRAAAASAPGRAGRSPVPSNRPPAQGIVVAPAPISLLPKGVKQTPKGDIGAHRQQESRAVGGFTAGGIVKTSRYFTSRYKGA